jgi:hypothetical protein
LLKIVLVIILLLAALPAETHAEMLASQSGGQYVLVFESKDTMDYFIKECAGKGNRAVEDDCLSCVTALVTSGTRCSIVDKTMLTRKVRIMQGPHKGKVGWVPMEMVRD